MPQPRQLAAVQSLIVVLPFCHPALGQNLVVNGSFEQGSEQSCGWVCLNSASDPMPGWQIESGSVDRCKLGGDCPRSESWVSIDGDISLDLSGCGSDGVISQQIVTEIGVSYRVRFQLTANCSGAGGKTIRVSAGDTANSFTGTCAGWSREEYTFVANGATTLLRFQAINAGGWNGPVIDDVSVIALPRVVGVLPVSGPSNGGTAITITGEHFGPTPVVRVGGIPATRVQQISSTQISAVTPPNLPGISSVSVDDIVVQNAFYYRPECGSDLDQNGSVDGGDLAILLLDWGPCYSSLQSSGTYDPPELLADEPAQKTGTAKNGAQ